jgi:hypothetical protein
MDVGFNLAQTATSLADMLEELEGDSRKSDVRALRVEARDVLDQVLQGQAAFLEKTREEGDDETTEEAAEAMGDGGGHAEEAVQQEAVNAEDDGSVEEDETGMEVDEDEDDNDGTYETHLPTPSTFIDTVRYGSLSTHPHFPMQSSKAPSAQRSIRQPLSCLQDDKPSSTSPRSRSS